MWIITHVTPSKRLHALHTRRWCRALDRGQISFRSSQRRHSSQPLLWSFLQCSTSSCRSFRFSSLLPIPITPGDVYVSHSTCLVWSGVSLYYGPRIHLKPPLLQAYMGFSKRLVVLEDRPAWTTIKDGVQLGPNRKHPLICCRPRSGQPVM